MQLQCAQCHDAKTEPWKREQFHEFVAFFGRARLVQHKDVGGRGVAYIRAQESFDNRSVGMEALMKCFSPSYGEMPGPAFRILDVLGGGGTVARFLSTLGTDTPTIFTADLSNVMISACRARKLAYIRQSASRSLFRDNVRHSPGEVLEALHDGLRSTRGGAVAVTEIDGDRGLVKFAGLGNIFASMIQSVARQPELRGELQGIMWLGFALCEAVVFYGLIGGLLAFVLV